VADSLDWNDLQTFLAVAHRGSVAGGAKWLGVNHSTVLRRVAQLEAAMGQRLFDRLPTGYRPTPEGQALVSQLADLPERIEAAHRRLAGGDLAIEGEIRITAPDTLVAMLLELLAPFRAKHPRVQLQVAANNSFLNLTQREADVAFRGSNRPPENLVGRKVGRIQTALYASRAYLKSLGRRAGREHWRWIGHDPSLAHLESAKWMRKHVPDAQVGLRLDGLVAMVDAVAAGWGVGFLLCPLAEARSGLVRIEEPMPALDTQLWVLTHPDLRHVARIRALTEHLAAALREDARLVH
jgi:DNA-binding transcriptional LysR family regulator